ncbi:MAG: pyruvate formate lyase family protein, partial [Ignavibacteria bacterium]|nr:pyruvate formate lyase family protein [Ignavibacteria bacterium]
MNNRINKLRQESLEAVNRISEERALLVTEFYKSVSEQNLSVPGKRAMCLDYILSNKHICINEGELIVGERGPAPKATPTYPEVCLHTPEDLDTLDKRKKVSFKVSENVKQAYENVIIPFWKGKSNREKIMKALPEEWHDAYKAGMFTEFQEQRAPGHTVAGVNIFRKGMNDFKKDIENAVRKLDNSNESQKKREQLNAMNIACDAI